MLYARTNAEAHLYMDLTPCACGDAAFERTSSVVDEGGVLCSRYAGACRSCGTERTFTFELPETIRPPARGKIEYGGRDPSRVIDPGQWLAVADHRAKLNPGTVEDLQVASAAL